MSEGPGPPGLLPWIRHCLISKPLSQLWSSLFSLYELLMSCRMDLFKLSGISLFMCLIIVFFTVLEVNTNWNSDVNMQRAFKMPTVPCFLSIVSVDKNTCPASLQGNLAKWNVFSTMEECSVHCFAKESITSWQWTFCNTESQVCWLWLGWALNCKVHCIGHFYVAHIIHLGYHL